MFHKPQRVLITQHDAVSLELACREFMIIPDIFFVRNDGWTLGAPYSLAEDARRLWTGEWVRFGYPNYLETLYVARYPANKTLFERIDRGFRAPRTRTGKGVLTSKKVELV